MGGRWVGRKERTVLLHFELNSATSTAHLRIGISATIPATVSKLAPPGSPPLPGFLHHPPMAFLPLMLNLLQISHTTSAFIGSVCITMDSLCLETIAKNFTSSSVQ